MTAAEARERFATARVARLASVDADGRPHLVPITFALLDSPDAIVFAVDHKPKRTQALKRIANIASNPSVCVLADGYSEEWSELWWARADGVARVLDSLSTEMLAALLQRYEPYRNRPPDGSGVIVEVRRWSGWSATG